MKRFSKAAALCCCFVFFLAGCVTKTVESDTGEPVHSPSIPAEPVPEIPPVPENVVPTWPAGILGMWHITDADGWIPPADGLNDPSVIFEDDYAAVYTGLNSLLAGYSVDMAAQTLSFDTSGPMTLVAGSDHAMHFESALLKTLPRVASFILDEADGILELYDADESLLLVLARQKTGNQGY